MAKLSKKESELNEQDSLQDMLNTEKMLMDNYLLAIKEGSTKSLRTMFMQNFNKAADDQYTVFKQMLEKGYYELAARAETDARSENAGFFENFQRNRSGLNKKFQKAG